MFPDVADADFLGWLAAADAVVDLRFPHRGEVSGSLSARDAGGRPTIVSATGTYLDMPDGSSCRWRPDRSTPPSLRARSALVDDEPAS